jgi:hypothetical protein
MKRLFVLVVLSCMSYSCKKEDVATESFMTATVNSLPWVSDKDMAAAQIDFNDNTNGHNLLLGGRMENPLTDGTRYILSISVNSPVSTGKFYFNNTKDEVSAIGGVAGNVINYKNNTDDFISSTINGFVEITLLTDHEVGGSFEYDAVSYTKGLDRVPIDTVRVRNGRFRVRIVMISGREWTAPK